MSLCKKWIHDRRWPYLASQCRNPALKGSDFCGTHSLEAAERRKKKQQERWAKLDEAFEKRAAMQKEAGRE